MRRSSIAFVSLAALLVPTLSAAVGNVDLLTPDQTPVQSSGDYIVVLKDGSDVDSAAADIAARHHGEVKHLYKHALKGFSAHLTLKKLKDLTDDPRVLMVSEDYLVSIAARPSPQPTVQTVPSGVRRIYAENKTNKGTGVEVAVIDTGIDLTHPDLKANILGGKNCVAGQKSFADQNGHGTHVAGTIAALQNTQGVVGVAPEAKLWSVRVLDRNGNGTWSSVICGIDFVTSQASHIKVANMSLGGGGTNGACNADALHQAVCNSVAAGVTYLVAAGNDGADLRNSVPAAYPEVLAVSALADSNGAPCGGGAATSYGADDTFASFSNYATLAGDVDRILGAPGVSILSTWKGGGYNTISGTSMATPHVAGAAALYIQTHPGSTPAQVRAALLATAEPGDVNWNSECGASATPFSHASGVRTYGPVLRTDSF